MSISFKHLWKLVRLRYAPLRLEFRQKLHHYRQVMVKFRATSENEYTFQSCYANAINNI